MPQPGVPLPPRSKHRSSLLLVLCWWSGLAVLGGLSLFPPDQTALIFRLLLLAWIATGVACRAFDASQASAQEKLRNLALAAVAAGTLAYFFVTSSRNPEEAELEIEDAMPLLLQAQVTIGVALAVAAGGLIGFRIVEIQRERRRRRRRSQSGS